MYYIPAFNTKTMQSISVHADAMFIGYNIIAAAITCLTLRIPAKHGAKTSKNETLLVRFA